MSVDQCQPAVEIALQKEGWTIVASPKTMRANEEDFFIDLEAERGVTSGSENAESAYIEVKCFQTAGKYKREDFYIAIGQYIVYRTIMKIKAFDVDLYLAMPADVFDKFTKPIRSVLEINNIHLIVDLVEERITQWIKW
jgi:hypothetical protein